jgi:hypothetical protein
MPQEAFPVAVDRAWHLRFRLAFLAIAGFVLLIVGTAVTGSLAFVFRDFWFSSGLLLLLLLSLVDQPHFSKDADIFLNGMAGLVSLIAVKPEGRSWPWWLFAFWSIYLVATSYVVMLRRRREPFLAFHIIDALASHGIKVLILDVSRQHWIFLQEWKPEAIKRVDEIPAWYDSDSSIGIHQFADATNYPERTARLVEELFKKLATFGHAPSWRE